MIKKISLIFSPQILVKIIVALSLTIVFYLVKKQWSILKNRRKT